MKYLKWLGAVVVVISVGVYLSYLAANAIDETLDPGAEAILKEKIPVTEQGTRAFYYLLGIRAGDEKNPEAAGRDLWLKGEAVPQADEAAFFKDKVKDRWPSIPFVQHPNETNRDEWKRQEAQDALAKAFPEIQQYIHLLEYGEISPLYTRDLYTAAYISPAMLLKGSKWLHVYLGKLVAENKWSEAERLVRLEAKFQKSFWQNQSLLSMMVGTVVLQADAHFLDSEKKLNPKLKVSPETVAALQMPETKTMIHESLRSEFRHFAAAMPMILNHGVNELYGEDAPEILKGMSVKRALLPNEAINQYYRWTKEVDQKICDDCYPSLQWSQPKYPWEWLRNPLGRKLMWIFTTQLSRRYEALEIKHKEIQDIRQRLS